MKVKELIEALKKLNQEADIDIRVNSYTETTMAVYIVGFFVFSVQSLGLEL